MLCVPGRALRNDVIVLFTDGEERGVLAADAFATFHSWMKDVGLIMVLVLAIG